MGATLAEHEKKILQLAVAPIKYPAARERKAREDFGITGIRFWQEVNRILDLPEAHAWDPHTVARLKEQRIVRGRQPLARRLH
jgi:hypothetical protein